MVCQSCEIEVLLPRVIHEVEDVPRGIGMERMPMQIAAIPTWPARVAGCWDEREGGCGLRRAVGSDLKAVVDAARWHDAVNVDADCPCAGMQGAGDVAFGGPHVFQNDVMIGIVVPRAASRERIIETEADFVRKRTANRRYGCIVEVDLDHRCAGWHLELMLDMGLHLIGRDPAALTHGDAGVLLHQINPSPCAAANRAYLVPMKFLPRWPSNASSMMASASGRSTP